MNKLSKNQNLILSIGTYFYALMLSIQLLTITILDSNAFHFVFVALSALPMIACVYVWCKKNICLPIVVFVIACGILCFEYLVYPENRPFFSGHLFILLGICIPCLINVLFIDDYECHDKVLLVIANAIFITNMVTFICVMMNRQIDSEYSMSFGYYVLIPALVYTWNFWKKEKVIFLIPTLFSVLMIILVGSRGPLLCWMLFLAFSIAFLSEKTSIRLISISLIAVLAITINVWIMKIAALIDSFGFGSRTLDMLFNNTITSNTGREGFQQIIKQYIFSHPILGNGLFSEYRIIGAYSHNIMLDFCLHFGLLIGIAIILGIIVLLIEGLIKSDQTNRMRIVFFACLGLVQLFFSNTYTEAPFFWVFLGFLFKTMNVRIKTIVHI